MREINPIEKELGFRWNNKLKRFIDIYTGRILKYDCFEICRTQNFKCPMLSYCTRVQQQTEIK